MKPIEQQNVKLRRRYDELLNEFQAVSAELHPGCTNFGTFSGKEPYKAVWCKNRIGGLV